MPSAAAPAGIPTSLVGRRVGAQTTFVDARWTMAYAAGIGDPAPAYLDTTATGGVVAHPLFPVCVEWPVIVAAGHAIPELGLVAARGAAGLHATHDLTVHRLIRPDEPLTTGLTVIGVRAIRAGALVTLQLHTVDATGQPVASTRQDVIYLGTDVVGGDAPAAPAEVPARPDAAGWVHRHTLAIGAGAAHVYTECARIWNPIHTDRAVAAHRGLAELPLHGTATLARAVSALLDGADPGGLRRVAGRFRALVPMPCELTLAATAPHDVPGGVARWFEVRTPSGEPAIDAGCLVTAASSPADADA